MKIVVTGGLGVNGAFVVRDLVAHGHDVFVFDSQTDQSLLGGAVDAIDLCNINILDHEGMESAIRKTEADAIIHLAAVISGIQENPLLGFEVNARGTAHLLDIAHRLGVRRFVYASSRAVYGDIGGKHAHPDYVPVTEDHPLNAGNVYDRTKLMGELMGQSYSRLGLEFVALRFATIFGPGKLVRHGPMGILSRIIENGMLGVPLSIENGGDERDDIIYVGDVARACVAAVEHDALGFPAYNIASGRGITLAEFGEAAKAHLPALDLSVGPGLDFFGAGVRYAGVLDNARAKSDLGFEPAYGIGRGVAAYIQTMQELGLAPMRT